MLRFATWDIIIICEEVGSLNLLVVIEFDWFLEPTNQESYSEKSSNFAQLLNLLMRQLKQRIQ